VAAAIRGAAIEVVPVTGHAVMIERPDWFNTRLARFLTMTSSAGHK
jgi:pimeloyl-ACP methyl ester carboxylesterase